MLKKQKEERARLQAFRQEVGFDLGFDMQFPLCSFLLKHLLIYFQEC